MKWEDIVFWLLIAGAFAVALWLLSGSPATENALVMLTMFLLANIVLLWRSHYKLESTMKISFSKAKQDLAQLRENLDRKLEKIEDLLK